jgi:hypothetical protein
VKLEEIKITPKVAVDMDSIVDGVIKTLNRMLEKDPDAIIALAGHRIRVNDTMASETSARCRPNGDQYTLGLLGVINGILDTTGQVYGPIMFHIDSALPHGAEFVRATQVQITELKPTISSNGTPDE